MCAWAQPVSPITSSLFISSTGRASSLSSGSFWHQKERDKAGLSSARGLPPGSCLWIVCEPAGYCNWVADGGLGRGRVSGNEIYVHCLPNLFQVRLCLFLSVVLSVLQFSLSSLAFEPYLHFLCLIVFFFFGGWGAAYGGGRGGRCGSRAGGWPRWVGVEMCGGVGWFIVKSDAFFPLSETPA